MNISIISAFSKNFVIGKQNRIPWYIPKDYLWFKKWTLEKPVIMGRLTWESIQSRPLKNRLNIILSKSSKFKVQKKNIIWCSSIFEAIRFCEKEKEIMIIGGETVYKQFLKYTKKMYLTYIDTYVKNGDSYFPKFNLNEWSVLFNQKNKADKKNEYNYCFKILKKL